MMISTKCVIFLVLFLMVVQQCAAECGICAEADGDCQGTVCYCKGGKFGTGCTEACTAAGCAGPQDACNTTSTCDDCSPECDVTGGTCRATGGTTPGLDCYCQPGYTGDTCDQNIDDCSPDPCQNGGNCTDGIASYTCSCFSEYTGTDCETDACTSDDDCKNNGSCTSSVCNCTNTWTGPTCAVERCNDDTNPCENGGTCGSNHVCDCAGHYTGDMCENSSTALFSSLGVVILCLLCGTLGIERKNP